MKENLKKLARYYKPYLGTFILDMILAMMSAAVALVIPLVVRFITSKVAYMSADEALKNITIIVIVLFILVLIQWGCNYYISNYGHVMGAKIEYDMRAEIFNHYQKLSYSFYDDQKVGQLLSRITSDLFDITPWSGEYYYITYKDSWSTMYFKLYRFKAYACSIYSCSGYACVCIFP